MNFKIVEEGKFKVYESGFIEKLKNGVYITAKMTDGMFGRNQTQPELIVSYTEDNIQLKYYAKRLIADAFVPSLNNSGFIDYLDGDYKNLNASNLFRKTQAERTAKMSETRIKNATTCKTCNQKTINWKHVCNDCLAIEKQVARLKKLDATKARRIAKAINDFDHIDRDSLKNVEIAYTQRKMQGFTLEEIGKEFGKSRERIRQVLAEVKERNA